MLTFCHTAHTRFLTQSNRNTENLGEKNREKYQKERERMRGKDGSKIRKKRETK